jgi:hypothetical protein
MFSHCGSKGTRHYTSMEKKIFLEILKRFEIVENKKSDGVTLRQKEEAWKDYCWRVQQQRLIFYKHLKRTVMQLKKLWANLKHSQREAMTKERQSRLMTGGGPVSPPAQLDPDIAAINGNGTYCREQ